MSQSTFKRKAHAAYFTRCMRALPSQAQEHDANRVTIAFFCLAGLELLGVLPQDGERDDWIEWLWSLQADSGGFSGSPSATAHLPSTYTALSALALLRAPLDKLNRAGLAAFLRACQAPDGSFAPTTEIEGEFQNDVRMSYCAAIARAVLRAPGRTSAGAGPGPSDSSGTATVAASVDEIPDVDVKAAIGFLDKCKTWEGGYSARPGLEAQGGTTYCATAALSLFGGLTVSDHAASIMDTTRWLTQRQIGGFQGRPGKLEDVCYSFWCGGALATLSLASLVNAPPNTSFLLDAQSPIGGFGKAPEDFPDPFHSYLALAALALTPARDELGLKELDPVWNLPPVARDWLLSGGNESA
ncbi:uncharacterized protein EHS24_002175 [Apiotrichum porosum]|uniref:Prenyltransferase alpha-alpha toroid domain-containing protein n=1 Tax=Apiotrichum porosum TaxID=105984 RepID=A0A427XHT7_9TREE|nr:uncharacterized protein EHS24_002175 [Apiotrichum porosum]RSH78450.1 hypothetical protein EHS24_002175 [Apiotrichum porosum]